MESVTRKEILVLGAGVAGLATALELRRRAVPFTLIETDERSAWGASRRGVPHADHLHNLLGRAQRHLWDLDPDLPRLLRSVGGVAARVATGTTVYEFGARMPQRDLGLWIWSIARSAVEAALAQALGEVPTIAGRVTRLRFEGGRVSGVDVETPEGAGTVRAEAVVDALGGRSPVRQWVGDAGCGDIPRVTQKIRQWYVTALAEGVVSPSGPEHFWLVFPTAPGTRGGLLSPLGDGRWKLSVNGAHHDPMPRTADELMAYAASLEDSSIAEALAGAVLTEPIPYAKPTAHWNQWQAAPQTIGGLLPVGDSVASLNPLFGQGISGVVWEASRAAAHLADWVGGSATAADAAARHRRDTGGIRSAMWNLMNVFDPECGLGLDEQDQRRIAERVTLDPEAHRRCVEVWHLLAPVSELRVLASGQPLGPPAWGDLWT